MAKAPSKNKWAQQAAMHWQQPPVDLKAARANWRTLSLDDQLAAVREIIETRADELKQAYSGVVALLAGFKRTVEKTDQPAKGKQAAAAGKKTARKVLRKPAVIFVVKRKWQKASEAARKRAIPDYLLTYFTVKQHRLLCAVPTDVEDAAGYAQVTPDGKRVQVEAPRGSLTGTVTCAVDLPSADLSKPPGYAMSCCHVFGMSEYYDDPPLDAEIRVDKRFMGNPTALCGELVGDPSVFSCDTALAIVLDQQALKSALRGINFTSHAESTKDIPKTRQYYIRTPTKAITACYAGEYTMPIQYKRIGWVRHMLLIESHLPDGGTIGGDSGSPVVTKTGGDVLLGMHIAGDNAVRSFMIPAWFLMACSTYPALSVAGRLLLRNP
jgi:hypothetical protein